MHFYCKTTYRIGFNITNVIVGEIPLNWGNKVVNFIIVYTKHNLEFVAPIVKRREIIFNIYFQG